MTGHVASSRRHTHSPPQPSSPPVTAENTQFSRGGEHWAAVPQIDVESICGVLDGISLREPDNWPQQSGRRTTNSTRIPESTQCSPPQVHKQDPPSRSIREPPVTFTVRPRDYPAPSSPSGASPSASRYTNQVRSPVPQSPSQAHSPSGFPPVVMPELARKKKKKYYVVTRGRGVGVFDSWYVHELYPAIIYSMDFAGLKLMSLLNT
jgi:hypothetical protein